MSNTSSSGGSKGPVMTVFEWVAALFTFWWYLPARALWKRAYAGWAGKGRLSLGFFSGIWAGTQSGSVHALNGFMGVFPESLPDSVNFAFGFLATTFYLFPLFYLTVYQALDSLWKPVEKGIKHLAEDIVAPTTSGYINTVKVLPFSSGAWNPVQDKAHSSWWLKLLTGILGFTALFGSLTLGWRLFNLGLAHAWTANWATVLFSQGVALLVGLWVARFTMWTAWELLGEGATELLAVGTSAATVYALAPYTKGFLGAHGFDAGLSWVALAVQFLLLTAYLFPVLDLALTAGFIRRVIKSLWTFSETVYTEPQNPFRTAALHLETLLVSLGVATLIYKLGAFLTMPYYGAVALGALAFLGFYGNLGNVLDSRGGNLPAGLLAAIPAGFAAWYLYLGAGLPFSFWGAIATGLLTLVVVMVPLFPLGYRGASLLVPDFASDLVGAPLAVLNKLTYAHWSVYREATKRIEKTVYDEETNYHKLFLHAANLLIAAGIVSLGYHYQAFSTVTRTILMSVGAIAGYALVGDLLLGASLWGTKVKVTGTKLAGLLIAVLLGVKAGFWTAQVQTYSAWLLPIVIGFGVAVVGEDLIFPALFALLRLLTDWAGPRDLALYLLSGIHSVIYNAFEFVWKPVKSIMNWLLTDIFWPILKLCVNILDGALSLLKRIFGLS